MVQGKRNRVKQSKQNRRHLERVKARNKDHGKNRLMRQHRARTPEPAVPRIPEENRICKFFEEGDCTNMDLVVRLRYFFRRNVSFCRHRGKFLDPYGKILCKFGVKKDDNSSDAGEQGSENKQLVT